MFPGRGCLVLDMDKDNLGEGPLHTMSGRPVSNAKPLSSKTEIHKKWSWAREEMRIGPHHESTTMPRQVSSKLPGSIRTIADLAILRSVITATDDARVAHQDDIVHICDNQPANFYLRGTGGGIRSSGCLRR
jgi:hypothetical protein